MIKMICDSTAYLPKPLIKKHGIEIIPLSVILGEEVLVETNITNRAFFKKLNSSHHHPTSSQPSVDSFYSVFEKHISNGDSIIFTCISSKMSGTYANAVSVKNMLKEKYPDAEIEIIDSESNCMQLGYAVLTGARMIAKDKSFEETASAVKQCIYKTRMLFIPESLKFLHKSGRLSAAQALMASILKIVPILTVENGSASVFSKIRTRAKAKNTMLSELYNDIKSGSVADISVIHIDSENEASKMIEAVKKMINIDINLTSIGPVIGAHVGPGTIGLVWKNK